MFQNGDGNKILCDRSMSDADEPVPGMIAPPKLTKGGTVSVAGLLGQAGVAASSAAAGAAAGASAAASITAKRHSIAPTAQAAAVDKGAVVRSTSGEISNLQEQGKSELFRNVHPRFIFNNLIINYANTFIAKKELTVETLEELMKSKSVREKRQEMDKKLEALRKKHEKVCLLLDEIQLTSEVRCAYYMTHFFRREVDFKFNEALKKLRSQKLSST